MNTFKGTLKNYLLSALKQAGYKDIEPEVLPTLISKYGDYYSTVALKLAKKDGKQTAEKIAKFLQAKLAKNGALFNVEVAKNGFLNLTLSSEFLCIILRKIIEENESFGKSEHGSGKKVQVEFISANPTGPLTIGNGRGGFMGDTLAYCLGKAGYSVSREYYVNDTGNQIKILGVSILDALGIKSEDRQDLYRGEYIVEIAKDLEKEIDIERYKNKALEIGEKAAQLILEKFIKKALVKTKIKFDTFISEKSLHEKNKIKAALNLLKNQGLIEEREGAIWFKIKGVEDRDRVLVRSKVGGNEPTYFLADIAYHLDKIERGFDKIINIWGADHAGYVARMKAAAAALDFSDRLDIIIVQLVRLIDNGQEVRMSKRTGTFISLEELVDMVGLDVARFFFISHAANTHMDFNLKLAKERSQKNPVYYVQYAHARCCSILKEAQNQGFKMDKIVKSDAKLLKHPSERDLIVQISKLPEITEDISENYSVHLLPLYVQRSADLFHKFYEQVRVIDDKDKETSLARLSLVVATKIALREACGLMGVSCPERMEKVDS